MCKIVQAFGIPTNSPLFRHFQIFREFLDFGIKNAYVMSKLVSKRFRMSGRSKLLIVISAIILIPVLLAMTPLNFIQKIGSGCPFAQGKQTLKCNPCPFHSIVIQDDLPTLSLASSSPVQGTISSFNPRIGEPVSIFSDTFPQAVPLRC